MKYPHFKIFFCMQNYSPLRQQLMKLWKMRFTDARREQRCVVLQDCRVVKDYTANDDVKYEKFSPTMTTINGPTDKAYFFCHCPDKTQNKRYL